MGNFEKREITLVSVILHRKHGYVDRNIGLRNVRLAMDEYAERRVLRHSHHLERIGAVE